VLSDSPLVAFVGSADLGRARAFYGSVLGLTAVEETGFACVFAAGSGATLRVSAVDRVDPAPYTVLGWSVADAAAVIDGLTALGVELVRYDGLVQDERGVWTAPGGARVAWFHDPDGNLLSITEPPLEAPGR
jgi:catechol 2,3-dioxygenase-like lactoylglutathione lyase family enzyme